MNVEVLDDRDHLSKIFNAEIACRRSESRIEELQEELKEERARLAKLTVRLRQLCNNQADNGKCDETEMQVGESSALDAGGGGSNASGQTGAIKSRDPGHSTPEDDAWRSEPISVLDLESIKRFGKGKIEALTEACPTLGDFQSIREKVGEEAAELHELLPKGIGQGQAEELLERFVNWISDHACGKASHSEAESITARAEQIREDEGNVIDISMSSSNDVWRAGAEAYDQGVPLNECPWAAGDKRDDWLRGWITAETTAKTEKLEAQAEPDDISSMLDDL